MLVDFRIDSHGGKQYNIATHQVLSTSKPVWTLFLIHGIVCTIGAVYASMLYYYSLLAAITWVSNLNLITVVWQLAYDNLND